MSEEKITIGSIYRTSHYCGHFDKIAGIEDAITLAAVGGCYCTAWSPQGTGCGSYCDSGSVGIGKLPNGKFIVIRESSDTSGHGCQCNGDYALYDSFDEAWKMGLGEGERLKLKEYVRNDGASSP